MQTGICKKCGWVWNCRVDEANGGCDNTLPVSESHRSIVESVSTVVKVSRALKLIVEGDLVRHGSRTESLHDFGVVPVVKSRLFIYGCLI